MQAGKSITGILKPLEILTRPQLPRKAPVAAAGQAQQAGAAAASQAPAASTAPGSSSAAAGAAGSQTAQQNAPPAEVCVSQPSLHAEQHVCTQIGVSVLGLLPEVKLHFMGSCKTHQLLHCREVVCVICSLQSLTTISQAALLLASLAFCVDAMCDWWHGSGGCTY